MVDGCPASPNSTIVFIGVAKQLQSAAMAIFRHLLLVLLLFFPFVLTLSSSVATTDSDLVAELLYLQSQSKSGVIHFTDHSIHTFLTSAPPPRSYYLVIFFDAKQLHDKSELRLRELHREFSILAASFAANNADESSPSHGKLFFCDVEFRESQSTFAIFGVNSVPHVRLVGPDVKTLSESDTMQQGDISKMAESMSVFIESKTKLTIGPIHRPPILSKNQLGFLIAVTLIWTPFIFKKLLTKNTILHNPNTWLAGSIFVYFFSVSGGMYNIIRNMPMYMVDQNTMKPVFFYHGSGMQLGTEGFVVGFLYTVVGLTISFIIYGVPKISNVNVQRSLMVVMMAFSFWAVMTVISIDNWKTGYGIHGFWPSSWS